MKINTKIEKLRELMKEKGVDFYIVPSSDYHQSEYVGEFFRCREWISGFTGSAGTVIVSKDEAGLWTDGRYFLQAEKELQGTEIKLFKMGEKDVPTIEEYIERNIQNNQKIGFDGQVLSAKGVLELVKKLGKNNIGIVSEYDLIGKLWEDRNILPKDAVFRLEDRYTGETFKSKLDRVRKELAEQGVDMCVISSLDDIAWLLNLRGNDIPGNPVFLSYMIITQNFIKLYVDKEKLNNELQSYLQNNNVDIEDYFSILRDINKIENAKKVLLDLKKTNYAIYKSFNQNIEIVDRENPTTIMKACKNPVEIENIRKSHLKDGVAVSKFMYWLKNNIGKIDITELSAIEKLESFRKLQENYFEPSFETICGYAENGAIIHYTPTLASYSKLEPKNLVLVDSGGQYLDGTTDITRTFVLGECSDKIKEHFTLVLKGLIKVSKLKFLFGITGTNLDILARESLWEKGLNYNHGTGHGIGYVLNVHEGPQGIRMQQSSQILQEGMFLSNEPGIYVENSHGIRLENGIIVIKDEKTDFGQFMKFETVTCVPFDLDGILVELLTEDERSWLNEYHKMVYEKISPFLDEKETQWLKFYTREI